MSGDAPDSVLSLPQGGGAIKGLGEKFSPDLFTGTGNFTVPIALPPGRHGFQPQVSLVYSTGSGNGVFGLGWSLDIPGVARKTSQGVPHYNEGTPRQRLSSGERPDVFILSGAEDLVPVSGDYPGTMRYRPRTEGLFAQIKHLNAAPDNYWEVAGKDGLVSRYGTAARNSVQVGWSDPAVLRDPRKPSHIFAWKLTETRDLFNNVICYDYIRDFGERDGHRWDQPLLQRIRYADYGDPSNPGFLVEVELSYEDRPDQCSDYRAGFEIRVSKRCRTIRVCTRQRDGSVNDVREYRLLYAQDVNNGVSILTDIAVVGFDDHGVPSTELPPVTFAYSTFEPAKRKFKPVTGHELPARALSDPGLDLVDLHGSGLPDILETNGAARYWRNLGGGSFDHPRPMRETPAHGLADPGVQIIDANGDGRADLLVTSGPLAGYYPLTHDASWDRRSFQAYRDAPSFNLDDPEVRLVDLDGDGITDILRSSTRLEHWFNYPDRDLAWKRTAHAPRLALESFPNINFSDPRVKLADMTGDGLQNIVLIHDGNVEYWPNLGHGRWGSRISMRTSPRYPYGYDSRRILLGDVDGDGLADIVYVDHGRVLLWLNHSGNAWSEEPVVIDGTPSVTDLDDLRLVDLYGSGVSGVLWTADATGFDRDRMMFLDFCGGRKPYLLNEMDNHMGAITRVDYKSSTQYYLEDNRHRATRWRTPLPFPVQVVSRVEAIDAISLGKLTSEYVYHHGYWDGAEREFRGFGMVEQLDTETIGAYHASELSGDVDFVRFLNTELERHFSPPMLTKNWFHQGPVGEEYGDWEERDYSGEYWDGDPQVLDHTLKVNDFLKVYNDRSNDLPSTRNRRIKRDALRTLRGNILRSEIYARDASTRERKPYSVTEYAYGLKEIEAPAPGEADRPRIFFPHLLAERRTQWERGDDPLTHFTLIDDYDNFGQPARETAVAMPRRADMRGSATGAVVGTFQPDETKILTTHVHTRYAISPPGKYICDRIAHVKSYELNDPPSGPDLRGDTSQTVLRKQWIEAQHLRDIFKGQPTALRVFNHTVNHYDGRAFDGLPVGELGNYGALVRTEVLVFSDELLDVAYADSSGTRRPAYLGGTASSPSNGPSGFGTDIGYRKIPASGDGYEDGWYADAQRQSLDVQVGRVHPRGLVTSTRDALGNDLTITYDAYDLLPIQVVDAVGLTTAALYNYRVLQPARIIDPNTNSTHMRYSPMGLPLKQFVRGTDADGDEALGGSEEKPEISFEYNFLHFKKTKEQTGKGQPVYVHISRRIQHASDNTGDDTIANRQYSDGYGRLIQTRAQAEEWIFGVTGDDIGPSSLPGLNVSSAVARKTADSVIVSGWEVFDNKGQVIKKYEPFFSQGFDFEPDVTRGKHATLFYDPRGNVIRTLNPDGSQQRVILGKPQNPRNLQIDVGALESSNVPDNFEPTPWETYVYDPNDLAPLSFAPNGASLGARVPETSHFTPTSGVLDALGRVLCQIQRNGNDPEKDWFVTRTTYDLRGNVVKIVDPIQRGAFRHCYDLLNRPLRVDSIDAGLRISVLDAIGNLIEYCDSKGSLTRRTYDKINRAKDLWARNDHADQFTLRERIHYGDEGDRAFARARNTLGAAVKYYDEAGLLETPEYDFKGNLLRKLRRTIRDTELANSWQAAWEKSNAERALEFDAYQVSSSYDAFNRLTEVIYPEDVDGERKKLIPRYNRFGALETVALDNSYYVRHIAYNAKGQRILIVYGNGLMTRYSYDADTFRLARMRTDRVSEISSEPNSMTFERTGEPIQDLSFSYDLAGNIITIDERVKNCGVSNSIEGRDRLLRKFDYDPIYRLTLATGRACADIGRPRSLDDQPRCGFFQSGGASNTQENAPDQTELYTESYDYDPAGNMVALHYQAGLNQWTRRFGMSGFSPKQWMEKLSAPSATPIDWGSEGNHLTNVGDEDRGRSCEFDKNGNLITRNAARHHKWDHADRMVAYSVRAAPSGPASIEARYLYGADGLRVKKWLRKNVSGSNDESIVYIDAGFDHHRWTERDTPKESNHLHVVDNQTRIAVVRVGDQHPDSAGEIVQYHLSDHIGSSSIVVGGTDPAGNAFINREEYFPYGETSFGSFGRKRYRYSGKERDEESGLYYFGVRYLAVGLCRWVSTDPAGHSDEINGFVYAGLNPIHYLDDVGLTKNPWHTIQQVAAKARKYLRETGGSINLHIRKGHDQGSGLGELGNPGVDQNDLARTKLCKPGTSNKLAEKTLRNFDRVSVQAGDGRYLFQKEFGRVVGRDGERFYRVVVNPKTGKIVTAFAADEFFGQLPNVAGGMAALAVLDQGLAMAEDLHPSGHEERSILLDLGSFLLPGPLDMLDAQGSDGPDPSVVRTLGDELIAKMEHELDQTLDAEIRAQIHTSISDALYGYNPSNLEEIPLDDVENPSAGQNNIGLDVNAGGP